MGEFQDAEDGKEVSGNQSFSQRAVVDKKDAALLSGNCKFAPRGKMRFNIDGGEVQIYVKFLSLLSSPEFFSARFSSPELVPSPAPPGVLP